MFLDCPTTASARRANRREEVLYDLPQTPLPMPSPDRSSASRQAFIKSIAATLRLAERGYRDAYEKGLAISEGIHANTCAGRVKGWVTQDDLEKIHTLMCEIHDIVAKRGSSLEDTELVAVTQVLLPVEARRVTRSRTDENVRCADGPSAREAAPLES